MVNNIRRRIKELKEISWNYDADIINSLTINVSDSDSKHILLQYANELELANSLWDSFISEVQEADIARYLSELSHLSVNTVEESRLILILRSALAIKRGQLDTVPNELIVRGVMDLLRANGKRKKVFYFSDTIKDGDIAKSKIRDHYEIINEKYGAFVQVVDYIGSTPGRSLQTGSQILDLLGSRAELESDYHENTIFRSVNIFVNNASRAKFAGEDESKGSNCLWARVRDPKTNALHNIIGVDNEAFMPFREYIEELYIINGVPDHNKLSDLSKGTQFRSLKHFIIPQSLSAITRGGCPPGFAVTKVDVNDQIPALEIGPDEVIMVNPDHYFNGKSLSKYANGIIGIAEYLGVELDSEVKAVFFHPDTNEIMDTRTLIITDHLGKHGGRDTIINGSSRGLNGFILPEIGRSWDKSSFNDYAYYIKEMPIGTRVKISRL
ncbi:hypothetical protein [Arenibacter latericius]|uniref:hypothetical protein n=1 Tax=Arenibacter latericius TaxID=86104 RepID=UPI00041736E9|nr:hypothetical protein [Arenibacter latericius]